MPGIKPINDPDYIKTNRQKVQIAKKEKFWCLCCDAALVGEIGKCPVCGRDNSKSHKRLKL